MTNTDAIEVRGPRSLDELVALIGPQVDETRRGYPVLRVSPDAYATVSYAEGDEYPYLIDIGSPGELEGRRAGTLALYRKLAESTPWALRQSSDDDDLEQVRPALRESA